MTEGDRRGVRTRRRAHQKKVIGRDREEDKHVGRGAWKRRGGKERRTRKKKRLRSTQMKGCRKERKGERMNSNELNNKRNRSRKVTTSEEIEKREKRRTKR